MFRGLLHGFLKHQPFRANLDFQDESGNGWEGGLWRFFPGKFGDQEDSFGVVELVAVKPFEDSIWPSEIKSQLFVWCF